MGKLQILVLPRCVICFYYYVKQLLENCFSVPVCVKCFVFLTYWGDKVDGFQIFGFSSIFKKVMQNKKAVKHVTCPHNIHACRFTFRYARHGMNESKLILAGCRLVQT